MENEPSNTPNLDIQGWLRGIRLVLALVTGLFACMALRSLMAAPGFERVFEEMLGDTNKLPDVTRFVVRCWPGLVLGIGLANLAGIILVCLLRKGFAVCCTAAGLVLLNFFTFQIAFSSLWAPMAELLKAFSAGPGPDVTSTL